MTSSFIVTSRWRQCRILTIKSDSVQSNRTFQCWITRWIIPWPIWCRGDRFYLKSFLIGPKCGKSGTFQVRFQSWSKKKVPDLSHLKPIWPPLDQYLVSLHLVSSSIDLDRRAISQYLQIGIITIWYFPRVCLRILWRHANVMQYIFFANKTMPNKPFNIF